MPGYTGNSRGFWLDYGVKYCRSGDTLHAAFEFIRGHCGKVATKVPPDRETGATAQAAIYLRHRVVGVLMLPNFNTGQPR